MSQKPLGIAVLGCGNMGARHATNAAADPRARVVALVDPRQQAAEARRHKLGQAATDTYVTASADQVLADPDISAVVIATHHDLHRPLAVAAAEAGKHILCEKPLALTMEDCQAIRDAVRAANVQLLMGFQARHAPLVRLAAGRVPRPRILFGQMIDPRWGDQSWAVHPVEGGGNVLSQGVHTFDLLCHLAGDEPVEVYAGGGTFTHDPARTDTVDSVAATIRFASGAAASLLIGDFGPSPWTGKSYYEIFDGAGHSATIFGYYEGVRFGKGDPAEVRTADLPEAERDDYTGYAALMREFVTCAIEGQPPRIAADVDAGVRATALALACFTSIRTGRVVRVSG